MNILKKMKKIGHKESEIRDFCIQTIRFKKFLENARALLDLFEDGREKALGEYIFDRHYVVTLIDSVVERLGMMVYDACVLLPESGEALYATYDTHKRTAENLIDFSGFVKKNISSGDVTPETSKTVEPEYQLLSEVLQWFNGKDAPLHSTVMAFMKQIFSKVVQGQGPNEIIKNRPLFENCCGKIPDMGIYLIDLWDDGVALPGGKSSIHDFNSIPLNHLLIDTGARSVPNGADWVAAVGEYQLSLNSLRADFQFRLVTLASGDADADFIFVFADNAAILDTLLPPGFHIENSGYGQFAWNLGISEKTIEDSLMIIGRNLFN
ncbi:MAG: hypothetical protein JEZ12_15100 [Desulfobacterium sp.]|nr:hypothetical protein [Desulfobacterium sp.]